MIQQPSVELEIGPAQAFVVQGDNSDTITQAAQLWTQATGRHALPACQVTVHAAPRRHIGLGSGTQLALSVAAGLNAWHDGPELTADELARLTGRGRRSAVGTYGFLHGGLIVESGKLSDDELSPLERRVTFPEDWRFVIVTPDSAAGLHGQQERQAFGKLPAVSPETRRQLKKEVRLHMLPAITRRDCEAFGESLYRYGRQAGECFAAVQGGPYQSQESADLVDFIRKGHAPGVGQSSWGPSLFCVVVNQDQADALLRVFKQRGLQAFATPADNQGAQVTVQRPANRDENAESDGTE